MSSVPPVAKEPVDHHGRAFGLTISRKPVASTSVTEKPVTKYIEDVSVIRTESNAFALAEKHTPATYSYPVNSTSTGTGNGHTMIGLRLERLMPAHRRYFFGRLSRNACMVITGVVFICILTLIIGLSVGLSRTKRHQNLPLPGNANHYTGDLTYYAPALGACGITSTDNDAIAAISHYVFDAAQIGSNPNTNPLCGKRIRLTRFNEAVGEQRSMDVTVVDRCVGCEPTDIDTTTMVFDQLENHDVGRSTVTWAWLNAA